LLEAEPRCALAALGFCTLGADRSPRRADAERGSFRIHAAARGGIEETAAGAAKAGLCHRQCRVGTAAGGKGRIADSISRPRRLAKLIGRDGDELAYLAISDGAKQPQTRHEARWSPGSLEYERQQAEKGE